jgi:hypothetical protein
MRMTDAERGRLHDRLVEVAEMGLRQVPGLDRASEAIREGHCLLSGELGDPMTGYT